jgi:hypothetical protein
MIFSTLQASSPSLKNDGAYRSNPTANLEEFCLIHVEELNGKAGELDAAGARCRPVAVNCFGREDPGRQKQGNASPYSGHSPRSRNWGRFGNLQSADKVG